MSTSSQAGRWAFDVRHKPVFVITGSDRLMLDYAVDTASESMSDDPASFTGEDAAPLIKLSQISNTPGTKLVVSGAEMTTCQAAAAFREVLLAELDNWVQGASQRLLWRAGMLLDIAVPDPRTAEREDCGTHISQHIVSDATTVAGVKVRDCIACFRLFPA